MARHTGPVCKLCRREGRKVISERRALHVAQVLCRKAPVSAGTTRQDTQFRRGNSSDYNSQLREKQKARRIYGILERQFSRYFVEAQRRPGLTGSNLLIILESRLDNVIYRLGLADSRPHARQMVQHGHFDIERSKAEHPLVHRAPRQYDHAARIEQRLKYFREIGAYMDERPRPPEWLST